MESGQTKTPSFLVGLKLAHVLGVTPAYLATGRDAPPETGSPLPDRSLALAERLATQISALDRRVEIIGSLAARRYSSKSSRMISGGSYTLPL